MGIVIKCWLNVINGCVENVYNLYVLMVCCNGMCCEFVSVYFILVYICKRVKIFFLYVDVVYIFKMWV